MKKKNKKINKIDLITRLKDASGIFARLGLGLFLVGLALTAVFFWTFIFLYYKENFGDAALLFLKLLDLSFKFITTGVIGYYLFYFIEDFLIKKGMKKYGRIKQR